MPRRIDPIAKANLERMERCRKIARDLGFQDPDGPDFPMVHTSELLSLSMTDPEVSWRLSIRERHPRWGGRGTYVIETASVDLSNLTESQFRSFLLAALTSVGIW
jgi:hypothetical protein